MSGGCFSISSLGGIGGRYFTPIINAPEVAILGVCRSTTEPRLGRQGVPAAPHPAALAQLGPPRRRRRRRGALQRLPDPGARRLPAGAAVTVDVRVPDIGDFKRRRASSRCWSSPATPSKVEQSLITIESDKASMEIPSSHAGVVKELKVKRRRQGQRGSLILRLEAEAAARRPRRRKPGSRAAAASPLPPRRPRRSAPPAAAAPAPARAPAAAPAASIGGDTRLRPARPRRRPGRLLGGVSRRRPRPQGRPRRALQDARRRLPERRLHSVEGDAARRRGDRRGRALRRRRRRASARPRSTSPSSSRTRTRSSAGSPAAWRRWPRCARSRSSPAAAASATPTTSIVDLAGGGTTTIGFTRAIIAAGSEAVKLPFMPKDDPRVVTSTGALELPVQAQADADRRRRHHRPRDGNGVLDARRAPRRRRDARRPDARRRPRPGEGLAEAQRAALRQHPAQDQDGRAPRRARTASW